MDKVYLRTLFITEKGFLLNLQRGEESASRLLLIASDKSLNVLIRILHLISDGQITLRAVDSSLIQKSKKMKKLLQFESKKYFLRMLNESRATKLTVLKQFVKIYPILLYSFFNEV